ncbi:MAG: hypothetical protein ACRELC_02910 [Gemmatimonadota bacterium]
MKVRGILLAVGAILALNLVLSLGWRLLHRDDAARAVALARSLSAVRDSFETARAWLEERAAWSDSIDALAERVAAGDSAYGDPEARAAAAAELDRRVREWNAAIEEVASRSERLDRLAARHDRLTVAYVEAMRRAYPAWSLLPRP